MPRHEGRNEPSLEAVGRTQYVGEPTSISGDPYSSAIAANLSKAEGFVDPKNLPEGLRDYLYPEKPRVMAEEEMDDSLLLLSMAVFPNAEKGIDLLKNSPFFEQEKPPLQSMRSVRTYDIMAKDIPPELQNPCRMVRTCIVAFDLINTPEGIKFKESLETSQQESLESFVAPFAKLRKALFDVEAMEDARDPSLKQGRAQLREELLSVLKSSSVPQFVGLWGYKNRLGEISHQETEALRAEKVDPVGLLPEGMEMEELSEDVYAILMRDAFGGVPLEVYDKVDIEKRVEAVLTDPSRVAEFLGEPAHRVLQAIRPRKDLKEGEVGLDSANVQDVRLYQTLVAGYMYDSLYKSKGWKGTAVAPSSESLFLPRDIESKDPSGRMLAFINLGRDKLAERVDDPESFARALNIVEGHWTKPLSGGGFTLGEALAPSDPGKLHLAPQAKKK